MFYRLPETFQRFCRGCPAFDCTNTHMTELCLEKRENCFDILNHLRVTLKLSSHFSIHNSPILWFLQVFDVFCFLHSHSPLFITLSIKFGHTFGLHSGILISAVPNPCADAQPRGVHVTTVSFASTLSSEHSNLIFKSLRNQQFSRNRYFTCKYLQGQVLLHHIPSKYHPDKKWRLAIEIKRLTFLGKIPLSQDFNCSACCQ